MSRASRIDSFVEGDFGRENNGGGVAVETQCGPCKRRGNRVIYNGAESCHECDERKNQADEIRRQRKEDRLRSGLRTSNEILHAAFADMGAALKMGRAIGEGR